MINRAIERRPAKTIGEIKYDASRINYILVSIDFGASSVAFADHAMKSAHIGSSKVQSIPRMNNRPTCDCFGKEKPLPAYEN